jgi:hypothetical protein
MLLTKPLLLKAVKTGMSSTGFTGPIVSAITSDAGAWCVTASNETALRLIIGSSEFSIDYAFRLIKSATTLLLVSLPPKRSFMPMYTSQQPCVLSS